MKSVMEIGQVTQWCPNEGRKVHFSLRLLFSTCTAAFPWHPLPRSSHRYTGWRAAHASSGARGALGSEGNSEGWNSEGTALRGQQSVRRAVITRGAEGGHPPSGAAVPEGGAQDGTPRGAALRAGRGAALSGAAGAVAGTGSVGSRPRGRGAGRRGGTEGHRGRTPSGLGEGGWVYCSPRSACRARLSPQHGVALSPVCVRRERDAVAAGGHGGSRRFPTRWRRGGNAPRLAAPHRAPAVRRGSPCPRPAPAMGG